LAYISAATEAANFHENFITDVPLDN